MKKFILLIFLVTFSQYILAQSCCSGGVPISSNIGLPLTTKNSWQFFIGYDLNLLNTLQNGRNELSENTRKRTTHTLLTQIGYSISNKFSIDLLIPYVRQEREITRFNTFNDFDYSQGIGDLVILPKYKFIRNYQIGVGIKLPTGSTTKTKSNGIVLNADLQPGSGSWDVIYWLSLQEDLRIRPSATASIITTYRSTGANDSYLGSLAYEFGNEFQITGNLSDQLLLWKLLLSPSLGLRYRSVAGDRIDQALVPSTGGEWLFLRPGIGYIISHGFNLQTAFDIPLYANIIGTQVTPTIRFNISMIYTLQTQKL